CKEQSLDDQAEFELNLVLEELFTNALTHGGCAGMESAVHVRLERRGDGVHVDFRDRGRAFDPLSAPEPDLEASLEDRGVGGLGVHLVRQIMRDLEYRREDGRNRITMRRPEGPAGSGDRYDRIDAGNKIGMVRRGRARAR